MRQMTKPERDYISEAAQEAFDNVRSHGLEYAMKVAQDTAERETMRLLMATLTLS